MLNFGQEFFDGAAAPASIVVHESGGGSSVVVERAAASDMRAATAIEGSGVSTVGGQVSSGAVSAATTPVSVNVASAGSNMEAKMNRETLNQASILSKSISESTVKKIKEAMLQAAKEK